MSPNLGSSSGSSSFRLGSFELFTDPIPSFSRVARLVSTPNSKQCKQMLKDISKRLETFVEIHKSKHGTDPCTVRCCSERCLLVYLSNLLSHYLTYFFNVTKHILKYSKPSLKLDHNASNSQLLKAYYWRRRNRCRSMEGGSPKEQI